MKHTSLMLRIPYDKDSNPGIFVDMTTIDDKPEHVDHRFHAAHDHLFLAEASPDVV